MFSRRHLRLNTAPDCRRPDERLPSGLVATASEDAGVACGIDVARLTLRDVAHLYARFELLSACLTYGAAQNFTEALGRCVKLPEHSRMRYLTCHPCCG